MDEWRKGRRLTGVPRTSKDAYMPVPSVIAIDGPVASGKTTVGKALSKRLNYRFIDTGMMYRACTLLALREGVAPSDADAVTAIAAARRGSARTLPSRAMTRWSVASCAASRASATCS